MTPRELEMLSAYHDGELGAREREEAERLLAGSAEARSALEEIRRMSAMVGGLPREVAQEGFGNRFAARAEREALLGSGHGEVKRSRFGSPALRWTAMAAAIALVVTGWYIYQPPYAVGRKEPIVVAEHSASVSNQLEGATSEGDARPASAEMKRPMTMAPASGSPMKSLASRDERPRVQTMAREAGMRKDKSAASSPPPADVLEIVIDNNNRKEALARVYKFIAETGAVRVPPEQSGETNVAVPGLDWLFLGSPSLPGLGGGDEIMLYVVRTKSEELFASLADLRHEDNKESDLALRRLDAPVPAGGNTFGAASEEKSDDADEVQLKIRFVGQPMTTTNDSKSQPTSGPAR